MAADKSSKGIGGHREVPLSKPVQDDKISESKPVQKEGAMSGAEGTRKVHSATRREAREALSKKIPSHPEGPKRGKKYRIAQILTAGRYGKNRKENKNNKTLKSAFRRADELEKKSKSEEGPGEAQYKEARRHFEAHRRVYEENKNKSILEDIEKAAKTAEKIEQGAEFATKSVTFVRRFSNVFKSFIPSGAAAAEVASDAAVGAEAAAEVAHEALSFADVAGMGAGMMLGALFLPVQIFTTVEEIKDALDVHAKHNHGKSFVKDLKEEKEFLGEGLTDQDLDNINAAKCLYRQHDVVDATLDAIDEVQSLFATATAAACSAVAGAAAAGVVTAEVTPFALAAGATVSLGSLGTTIGFMSYKKGRHAYKHYQKKKWNEAGPNHEGIKEKALRRADKEVRAEVRLQLKDGSPKKRIKKSDVDTWIAKNRSVYVNTVESRFQIIHKEERAKTPKYKEARRRAEKEIIKELNNDPEIATLKKSSSALYKERISQELGSRIDVVNNRTEAIIHEERLTRDVDYAVDVMYENLIQEQSVYLDSEVGSDVKVDTSLSTARMILHFTPDSEKAIDPNDKEGIKNPIQYIVDAADEDIAKSYLKMIVTMN